MHSKRGGGNPPRATRSHSRASALSHDTASEPRRIGNVRGSILRRRGRSNHWSRSEGGSGNSGPSRVRAWCAADGTPCPTFIERQLLAIEALTLEIDSATDELVEIAEKNPIAVRLMTIPGVGPMTSIRFIAAVDDISRFDNAHRLESNLGVTPGEHSSSDSRRITSITKAGSAKVRWLLVQSAWSALRTRPQDPMCVWATRIAERRGRVSP